MAPEPSPTDTAVTEPPPTTADHASAHNNISISAIKHKNGDDAFFNLPPSTPSAAMAMNEKLRSFDVASESRGLLLKCSSFSATITTNRLSFAAATTATFFPYLDNSDVALQLQIGPEFCTIIDFISTLVVPMSQFHGRFSDPHGAYIAISGLGIDIVNTVIDTIVEPFAPYFSINKLRNVCIAFDPRGINKPDLIACLFAGFVAITVDINTAAGFIILNVVKLSVNNDTVSFITIHGHGGQQHGEKEGTEAENRRDSRQSSNLKHRGTVTPLTASFPSSSPPPPPQTSSSATFSSPPPASSLNASLPPTDLRVPLRGEQRSGTVGFGPKNCKPKKTELR